VERAQHASGTGKNYAIALSGLSGVTSNYNDLFANELVVS